MRQILGFPSLQCGGTDYVRGETLEVSIERVDLSFHDDGQGNLILLPDGDFFPPIFMVRGVSISQWDSMKKSQLGATLGMLFVDSFVIIFVMLSSPDSAKHTSMEL
jgi:hypothetical protein